ncbi:unnamed protein product [Amoebophrya sp. A25]|nr:unnamed protein product [Amoebophrya sp. A25]|eukprot:GSA25T00017680001.1
MQDAQEATHSKTYGLLLKALTAGPNQKEEREMLINAFKSSPATALPPVTVVLPHVTHTPHSILPPIPASPLSLPHGTAPGGFLRSSLFSLPTGDAETGNAGTTAGTEAGFAVAGAEASSGLYLVGSPTSGLNSSASEPPKLMKNSSRRQKKKSRDFQSPGIKAKLDFAERYMNTAERSMGFPGEHLATRLIAFACVEGIMFASAFATIFFFKHSLEFATSLPSLIGSNDYISRDETLHTEIAVYRYWSLYGKSRSLVRPRNEKISQIIKDAANAELMFVNELYGGGALGDVDGGLLEDSDDEDIVHMYDPTTGNHMNGEKMAHYVKYVANDLFLKFVEVPDQHHTTRRTNATLEDGDGHGHGTTRTVTSLAADQRDIPHLPFPGVTELNLAFMAKQGAANMVDMQSRRSFNYRSDADKLDLDAAKKDIVEGLKQLRSLGIGVETSAQWLLN